ncbi:MAG: hypothetical protein K6D91_06035 [Prevotella sp.]|nr:hypothetical protein [Prevotella sp.]
MKQTIQITLIKSLILNSVKNETFLRGQVTKAADGRLITEAYHEQAGDEAYQMAILNRGLYTNLEELKTHLSDYLADNGQTSSDNLYSVEEGDKIVLHIDVSSRFNKAFSSSLARLSSKYIEEAMLMDWWKPINEKQSALYAQFVERDLTAIRRCFNKTAPVAPVVPYTTSLEVYGSSVEIQVGHSETITYAISGGAIDDIEARTDDSHVACVVRSNEGFEVLGKNLGHARVELYSRHNEELSKTIHVYVIS